VSLFLGVGSALGAWGCLGNASQQVAAAVAARVDPKNAEMGEPWGIIWNPFAIVNAIAQLVVLQRLWANKWAGTHSRAACAPPCLGHFIYLGFKKCIHSLMFTLMKNILQSGMACSPAPHLLQRACTPEPLELTFAVPSPHLSLQPTLLGLGSTTAPRAWGGTSPRWCSRPTASQVRILMKF
jgi:hypothetical protein